MRQALRKRLFGQDCLATAARDLARALTRVYDTALRPVGLTVAQLNLLVVLFDLGDARQADLVARTGIEQSSLSRNLKRLQRLGLIAEHAAQGPRGPRLALSPRGGEVLERAVASWEAAQEEVRELLGEHGTQSLLRARAALRV